MTVGTETETCYDDDKDDYDDDGDHHGDPMMNMMMVNILFSHLLSYSQDINVNMKNKT